MSTVKNIVKSSNPAIIYADTDARGRQEFTVRLPTGHKLYSCRKRKALVSFLKSHGHQAFVYDELPRVAREKLDQLRAETRHDVAKQAGAFARLRTTLGSQFPQLQRFKQDVPHPNAG